MASCEDYDADFALALKLQEQFDAEIPAPAPVPAKSNKPEKRKIPIFIDSEDSDDDHLLAIENLDYEIAKRLEKEINYDNVTVPIASSKQQEDSDNDHLLAIENLDYEIAKRLEKEINGDNVTVPIASSKQQSVKNIVDDNWELIDPNPDIHALFLTFNDEYFYGKLKTVEVKWSSRMTLCAGLCCYEGRGGLCSVRLSMPLLKLRPRRDLVQTLLHEMIHAYLFVTGNNKDHDAHGPEFHQHMFRINAATGAKITVYHSFHDEVNLYKVHWWRCNGRCREQAPYYGYVKRSMNRPPQPADSWYMDHQIKCGGTYTKIKEPEPVEKKPKKSSDKGSKKAKHSPNSPSKPSTSKDIRSFFDNNSPSGSASNVHTLSSESANATKNEKGSHGSKGGYTKMNSTSTVTLTNVKKDNFKTSKPSPPRNTGSNVFTINSFSANSPTKKKFNSFSGQGRSLGST